MGNGITVRDGRYVLFLSSSTYSQMYERTLTSQTDLPFQFSIRWNPVLASHPPLFGFAFSMTMIGYTFGFWPGALLAVAASMTGAGVAFLSVRVSPQSVAEEEKCGLMRSVDVLLAVDETVWIWQVG
jgi:hypothetical protein